jgi:two-component system sensor histidine kinase CpxA
VRRLFLTIFLWFWLTLLGVGLVSAVVFAHAGTGSKSVLRLMAHDLSVFVVAGGIFCYFISSYLTKPLHRLGEAAANIAEGRLDTRTDPSLRKRRDEIAVLAGNFDLMAERIEALVTGQRRLLGDVSHELRSPLARLMVALSLVRSGPADEAAENLDRIALEARRLDNLIGQLLTLTRIDNGADRGSPVRFDLTNLMQEVAADADFEARAHHRRVTVQQNDACSIEGFEELLRSAVENVVRNAIRHTAEGTTVEISLRNSNSQALLAVRDHGPGVPQSMLSEIFLPFRRVTNDGSDGAGLGLAIAERAVHLHQGSIRSRNAPEGGLIVEIVLAACQEAPLPRGRGSV